MKPLFSRSVAFLALCPLFLLLFGCSAPELALRIQGDLELLPSQPPADLRRAQEIKEDTSDVEIGALIEIEKRSPFSQHSGNWDRSLLFKRDYLLPTADIYSPRRDISVERLKGFYLNDTELPDGLSIQSPEEIALPLRGLSVGGTYLGDPDYPLYEDYALHLRFEKLEEGNIFTRKARKAELDRFTAAIAKWLNQLEQSEEELSYPHKTVWIHSVGDMMFERGVAPALSSEDGLETVFSSTLTKLQGADLTIGNLEGTISSGRRRQKKSYNFAFPSSILPPLKKAGFDYLMLTNNHVWDYREEGFLDTLRALKEAQIPSSGAGKDLKEASTPWKSTQDTSTVTVLSVGAYPRERNGFDGKSLAAAGENKPGILFSEKGAEEAIKKAFSGEGFHLLYIHGGYEWISQPAASVEQLYRSYADLGADLIIGSHPHVLQRMEVYKNSLIAYSLGNFLFPGMEGMAGACDSLILRSGISNSRLLYVEPIPAKLKGISVELDDTEERLKDFLSLP